MKKLEAAMRDRAAQGWRERKTMYKVGSYFKGCADCGETEWVETRSGREVLRYLSGHNVFRSYDPRWVGWTWWCYTCGSKDLKCWALDEHGLVEAELGKPPVQGTREAKKHQKYVLLKSLTQMETRVPSRADEIARLEGELVRLMEMLKGGK